MRTSDLILARELKRKLLLRLEFHYTPKQGSWLNMDEIEITIVERNAFSHCLEDKVTLSRWILAVETEHNAQRRGISWQFTLHDTRVNLERLYPLKDASPELSCMVNG